MTDPPYRPERVAEKPLDLLAPVPDRARHTTQGL